MTNKYSFAQYIKERFYNQIFTGINRYIDEHKNELDFIIPRYDKQWGNRLYDIDITHVNAEDNDPKGMRIDFYPIVIASVAIYGRVDRAIESDTKELYFRVHCTGDLSKNLQDFKITRIEEYTEARKRTVPVTDGLVPFIKSSELDKPATRILREFYPEVLSTPQCVDASILAQRMGLSIVKKNISCDMSIWGQMYFHGCTATFYDKKAKTNYTQEIPANTIVIDPDASGLMSLSSENITIAHECVHYALHRKCFEFERLYNEDFSKIQCGVSGEISNIARESQTSWMEWQASFIAPKIIMPLAPFKQKAEEFISKRLGNKSREELIDVVENVIRDLASFFKVSRIAAKMRMIDIGYEEAIGAYTYIDGHYVKPHKSSSKHYIGEKQTYSICREDATNIIISNGQLLEQVCIGKYIYVDSHIVLNAPKYVEMDVNGKLQLTKYARYNMDECCLIFDIEAIKKHDIQQRYYVYCVLNRDINAPYELQMVFHDGYAHASDEKQNELLRKSEVEAQQIYISLPNDFKGTMEALKKWKHMTNQELADDVGCDERTIRRIINEETSASIQNIVAICMALKLPPHISLNVIDKSSAKILFNKPENWSLFTLLVTSYGKSMEEVRHDAQRLGIIFF